MNKHLENAISLINSKVYSELDLIFNKVCPERKMKYRILVWGSIVDDRDREPNDIDIIIEYKGEEIEDSKKKSIESWLEDSIIVKDYEELDCSVVNEENTKALISNSKVSKTYSVDDKKWINYD